VGIAIRELLALEYFEGFRVLAGAQNLDREVQGVTVLDAPDSFRWTRGKELILSSGYVLQQDPDCVARWQQEGYLTQMACLVIKAGRYLTPVPPELIRIFEENGIPLLEAPFSVAYMDLMHQVNVAIMNKTTKRFRISDSGSFALGETSYKERKIRRILQAVEVEMNFPALLWDLTENRAFASSSNFQRVVEAHGLGGTDFWEPRQPCTRHTLCDSLHMVRYRLQEDAESQPRFSWITVPIVFEGTPRAYFVVMESRGLIDYFDEYALRIAALLLQSVYEQVIVARNVGDIGFENLILLALSCRDPARFLPQAGALNLNINQAFFFAVLRQKAGDAALSTRRAALSAEAHRLCRDSGARLAFLSESECLILFPFGGKERERLQMRERLEALCGCMGGREGDARLEAGYFEEPGTLQDVPRNVERCRQALALGQTLYPDRRIWSYEEFGPLAWLKLPEDELSMMAREFLPLLGDPRNVEMLKTLKVYLASNMSFSDTAEKQFVHINTVRKRIERVNDLLHIDWEDSFARMKLELLLQFLKI
jgi:purine catabolism regulator